MLNSIDLYYKIQMPEHFLIGHGLGAVFSKACYGNYLVVFQNVTIGVQDGLYPSIGDKTVIYPNCIIAGKTIIGENSVIGAGTKLINKTIPDCSLVFEKDGNLCVKQNTQSEIEKYFRIN
jgi:serine O-acetyltransferase